MIDTPPPDVCCLCNPLLPNDTPRPEIPAAVLRYRLLPTRTDQPACEHVKAALAWSPFSAAPCWVYACTKHLWAAKDLGRVLRAEALGTGTVERAVKD